MLHHLPAGWVHNHSGFGIYNGDDDDEPLPAFPVELLPELNKAHTYFSTVNAHVLILVVKIKAGEATWINNSASHASVLRCK